MTIIKQSNSHHCFVCGMENPYSLKLVFEGDGSGYAYTQTVFKSEYQGYPGIVHGGVITAALDETAARATLTGKRPEFVLVTGKIVVHFRKPVKINKTVTIEGRFIEQKGRIFLSKSWIKEDTGEILAEADVTLVQPRNELSGMIQPDQDDEWVDFE